MSEQRVYLNRERFKSLPKPPTESVFVDSWQQWVLVRGLSAGVAIDLLTAANSERPEDIMGVPGLIARIVADTVVDEDGARIFRDVPHDEIDGQPIDALMAIVSAAINLTKFNESEAIAKN